MLFLALLLHMTNAVVYYIKSDDNESMINYNDTESAKSLEYYLKNTSQFFSSGSQLHFKMGHHYLNTDLVIQNVTNVTLTGESLCIIRCTSHVSIIILNVTKFRLENIAFENCIANYHNYLTAKLTYNSKLSKSASIVLHSCTSVEINNITVTIQEGNSGMLIINPANHSQISSVTITIIIYCLSGNKSSLQTNGIVLCYEKQRIPNNISSEIQFDNFQFTTNGSCSHPLYYAITSLLLQNNANVSVVVQNTTFNDLINVTALYYYGETCGTAVRNSMIIRNCVVSNNTGNPSLKLFHITLNNIQCFRLFKSYQLNYRQQHTKINFTKCNFENNCNMSSIIYVSPAISRITNGYFYLGRNTFHNNRNTHLLIMNSDTENIWQFSNYVEIAKTNITSNLHDEFQGQDLMSFTNSWVAFTGPIIIMDNHYYTNIVNFHLSICILHYSIYIVNNTARQILSGSFLFLNENTTLDISRNTVYILLNRIRTYSMNSEPICTVQFYTALNNLNVSQLSIHIIVSGNIHMNSKYMPNYIYNYNCRWLAGNAFLKAGLDADKVYKELLQVTNNTAMSKDEKRKVPLSICKCTKLNSGSINNTDCYSPHLGSIFPGQTLKVELILQRQWLYHNFSMPIVVENTIDDNCSVVDISQMSQSHLIHGCDSYSYTLWPKDERVEMCELFIGLPNMPEMFYVQFKLCPLGFTLQENRKSCYCDPVLSKNKVISIKSCNFSDETILRPAYSWISAKRDDNTYNTTYMVSSYCPFQLCLPQQSYLNLSNPDSQCQFNRTGLLCGKCYEGLSTVFGSIKCKQCSNIYLLLIIPIVIAGIVFVTLLYIFNLTVSNGTVNTCIFYINILNINVYMLFPNCDESFACVALSYMNFDFRTKSCFYNGMDNYVKAWLHLLLPLYLISIAIVFITLSRYSATVQRFTAKKALPVLATLFLLSYTKVLIMVSNVLFRYSTVTHLPSNKTELVWSISTTTPLFGVEFLALFIVCIILFLILLPFNLILIFARKLSCLRLVTTFKPILDTYFGPYKDSAYYWTGLLLLIRVIVYVLLVLDEDISLLAIPGLLGGLLCLHAAVQPFKRKVYNIQECTTILNLSLAYSALSCNKNLIGIKIAKVLTTIGVVYFILVIVLHCIMYRWNSIYNCIKWLHSNARKWSYCKIQRANALQEDHGCQMKSFRDRIQDKTYNYEEFQEPLVALEPSD